MYNNMNQPGDRVSPSEDSGSAAAAAYQSSSIANPAGATYGQMAWNRSYQPNDYWSMGYQSRQTGYAANQLGAYRQPGEETQPSSAAAAYLTDASYAAYYQQHLQPPAYQMHQFASQNFGSSKLNANEDKVDSCRLPLREVKPSPTRELHESEAAQGFADQYNDANNENAEETRSDNDTRSPTSSSFANSYPAFFTTQKVVANTAKLSYTDCQLEILNAIYNEMRYPNADQKTKIATFFNISREQVKIWFQNRRRKDTLVSQGKMPASSINTGAGKIGKRRRSDSENDDNDNSQSSLENQAPAAGERRTRVDPKIIDTVLGQLRSLKDAPSRLSTKRTKLSSPCDSSDNLMSLKALAPVDLAIMSQARERMVTIHHNKPAVDVNPILVNTGLSKREDVAESTSNNSSSSASSSSLLMIPSSSSSSSSASGTSGSSSSSEEEAAATTSPFQPAPPSFQVLQQPVSIQEYLGNRLMPNYQFKVHNSYRPSVDYQNVTPPPSQPPQWPAVNPLMPPKSQQPVASYMVPPPAPVTANDNSQQVDMAAYKPASAPVVYPAQSHMQMFNATSSYDHTAALADPHQQHLGNLASYYPHQTAYSAPHIDYQTTSNYDPAYKALCPSSSINSLAFNSQLTYI